MLLLHLVGMHRSSLRPMVVLQPALDLPPGLMVAL